MPLIDLTPPAELTTEQKAALSAKRIEHTVLQLAKVLRQGVLALRKEAYANPAGLTFEQVSAALGEEKTATLATLDAQLTELVNSENVAPGFIPPPPGA